MYRRVGSEEEVLGDGGDFDSIGKVTSIICPDRFRTSCGLKLPPGSLIRTKEASQPYVAEAVVPV